MSRPGQTTRIIISAVFAVLVIGLISWLLVAHQRNVGKPKVNKKTTQANKNSTVPANENVAVVPPVDWHPLSTIPADWKTYTNGTYSYSLKYPPNWLVQEVTIPNHPTLKMTVRYITLTNPERTYELHLGVRNIAETVAISERTGPPPGTIEKAEPASVGYVVVPTWKFVDQGKVKTIFYSPIKPLGYDYLEAHEIQAEFGIGPAGSTNASAIDLLTTAETQLANTILATVTFPSNDSGTPIPVASPPPLGKFKIESYRASAKSFPDTRLISIDGQKQTILIESTRAAAQLISGHGLMELAFPGFGTKVYLQDVLLSSQTSKGTIWVYDVKTMQLTPRTEYPPIGWGTIAYNRDKTKAVYTSSINSSDNGDIKKMYLFDFLKDSLLPVVALTNDQTFSAGWGGPSNSFSILWKNDTTVHYSIFNQTTGNKQLGLKKEKIAEGEVTVTS